MVARTGFDSFGDRVILEQLTVFYGPDGANFLSL